MKKFVLVLLSLASFSSGAVEILSPSSVDCERLLENGSAVRVRADGSNSVLIDMPTNEHQDGCKGDECSRVLMTAVKPGTAFSIKTNRRTYVFCAVPVKDGGRPDMHLQLREPRS